MLLKGYEGDPLYLYLFSIEGASFFFCKETDLIINMKINALLLRVREIWQSVQSIPIYSK